MAATVTASANVDNGSTSGTTITVSVTIAAGDNCVVFTPGGYDPTSRLSATATINGSSMTRLEENHNTSGGAVPGQHSTVFVMYDDDANWPGTGTFSCVATFTGNLQQKGAVAALAGVDVGGTPSAGSTSGNNATTARDTTVSLTVGSETIDQDFNGNGVSWSGSSVVLNASSGDGIQLMYINTYSNGNSGAGTGDTIHESTSNGGSSSSLILLSRVVSGGGGGTTQDGGLQKIGRGIVAGVGAGLGGALSREQIVAVYQNWIENYCPVREFKARLEGMSLPSPFEEIEI